MLILLFFGSDNSHAQFPDNEMLQALRAELLRVPDAFPGAAQIPTATLTIADVSDKGFPAALYMALTRSLIRAEARRESSPKTVLSSVNRLLLELGEPGMFVTVFYAVLDAHAHRLTYGRAGHDEPLLVRDGEATALAGPGMLLGVFEDAGDRLVETTVDLRPGDLLVFYTDGLTDVRNPRGETLGTDGWRNVVLSHADDPAAELCRRIFADLQRYLAGEDQGDDMTLLIVADGRTQE